jgi:hypothetical protein
MPRPSSASLSFPGVTGAPSRLAPPPDLGPDERQVFCDLVGSSKPDAFRDSDQPLLSAYCRAIVLERSAAAELAGGDGKALAKWNGAVKAVVALSMRLRLSPQSRQPHTPGRAGGKVEPTMSYYQRMSLLEGEDGPA